MRNYKVTVIRAESRIYYINADDEDTAEAIAFIRYNDGDEGVNYDEDITFAVESTDDECLEELPSLTPQINIYGDVYINTVE